MEPWDEKKETGKERGGEWVRVCMFVCVCVCVCVRERERERENDSFSQSVGEVLAHAEDWKGDGEEIRFEELED